VSVFGKSAKNPFFQKETEFLYIIPKEETSRANHLPKFEVIWTVKNRDIAV